jgi:integrase
MAKLTSIAIANAKPRAKPYELRDHGAQALHLAVFPTGRKSWNVRYRFEGRTRKLTLNGFPPLAMARRMAAQAMEEVAAGRDPAAAKRTAKAAAKEAAQAELRDRDTIERLAEQFCKRHARRKTRENSARATEGIFRNIVLPAWRTRSVHSIVRRDVIDLIEGVAVDRPVMANRVKAALSKYFNWLAAHDVIAASPCAGVSAPSKEVARDRALSDDELRRLWLAAEAIGGPAGACIKLLILTGQRRSEIANLRFNEVDGDLLTIGAERMKGRAAHLVPLSTQAGAIFASIPKLVPGVPRQDSYVFGSPIGHFDRIKQALDVHMGETPKWVIHDIRRSVASGMARIGVAVPTIEKILAHRSGTFRGIVGTYQRHSFLPEMVIAMQRWADHIERLVGGTPGTVLKLPQRR